jgi:NAD(P)-dependent dehydrogenase (short-subunit alcohol dehydrogenase family)
MDIRNRLGIVTGGATGIGRSLERRCAADGVRATMVADDMLRALQDGRLFVLPHPQLAQYLHTKGQDGGRWPGGMQKMHARHTEVP